MFYQNCSTPFDSSENQFNDLPSQQGSTPASGGTSLDKIECEVLNGTGYESEIDSSICKVESCDLLFHVSLNSCESNFLECLMENGTGEQSWNGLTYEDCAPTSCIDGFHSENNFCMQNSITCSVGTHEDNGSCISNTKSCSVDNGTGEQIWVNGSWGACQILSCDDGYSIGPSLCLPDSLNSYESYWPMAIDKYVQKTDLLIVPTSITVSSQANLSGVTWIPQLSQYISVRNGNGKILVHDSSFNVINQYDVGTGPDVEDIVQLGCNGAGELELLMSDERQNIFRGFIGPFDLDYAGFKHQFNRDTHPEKESAQEIQYRDYSSNNLGAEGVAYDPETGRVWACLETRVIKTAVLGAYVKNQVVSDLVWTEPFDGTDLPIREIASCLYNPVTSNLLILSDEGDDTAKIIEVDPETGKVIGTLNIDPGSYSGNTNYEGMTFNTQLDLILVSEPFHYQTYSLE